MMMVMVMMMMVMITMIMMVALLMNDDGDGDADEPFFRRDPTLRGRGRVGALRNQVPLRFFDGSLVKRA